MLSQQVRNSASLLDSIDAVRNWRAVLLMLTTFVVTALVLALGAALGSVSGILTLLFSLLALAVAFYGANAVGMMMMDEANGQPSRPILDAVTGAMLTAHRLVLVGLIVLGIYLLALLAFALVLLLCKIPGIGPLLYTVVFPAGVLVFGVAWFAVPTVIVPLSAPAVWNGAGVMACVSQVLAVARKRLLLVFLLMVAVGLIAAVVGFLIGGVLGAGVLVTGGLSATVLGGRAGGFEGMFGGMMGGYPGMDAMGGGYATAAMVGGGALFAAAFTLPAIVYLRGACTVYLRAIDGLDLEAERAALNERLAAAQAKAREMQAQAQAKAKEMQAQAQARAQHYAQRAHGGDKDAQAGPADAPSNDGSMASARCPSCGAEVVPEDAFCGACGHKLT